MKLKILFSVILLSAISQLSSTNMTYLKNRINLGHNYRSQCASHLCSGPNYNWFQNSWNNCIANYIPYDKVWSDPSSVTVDVDEMRRRYFIRDCDAIGGKAIKLDGYQQIQRGSDEAWICKATDPTGRFIRLACGFNQNQVIRKP